MDVTWIGRTEKGDARRPLPPCLVSDGHARGSTNILLEGVGIAPGRSPGKTPSSVNPAALVHSARHHSVLRRQKKDASDKR